MPMPRPKRTAYVVGFMRDLLGGQVVLVRKVRPAWQEGLLNGSGGKVKVGERPLHAMAREFKEETGVTCLDWALFARSDLPEAVVYFYKATVGFLPELARMHNEVIECHTILHIMTRNDLVPDVKWLLMFAFGEDRGLFLNVVGDWRPPMRLVDRNTQ